MSTIEGLQRTISARETYISKLEQDIRNIESQGGNASGVKGILSTQQSDLQSNQEQLFFLQRTQADQQISGEETPSSEVTVTQNLFNPNVTTIVSDSGTERIVEEVYKPTAIPDDAKLEESYSFQGSTTTSFTPITDQQFKSKMLAKDIDRQAGELVKGQKTSTGVSNKIYTESQFRSNVSKQGIQEAKTIYEVGKGGVEGAYTYFAGGGFGEQIRQSLSVFNVERKSTVYKEGANGFEQVYVSQLDNLGLKPEKKDLGYSYETGGGELGKGIVNIGLGAVTFQGILPSTSFTTLAYRPFVSDVRTISGVVDKGDDILYGSKTQLEIQYPSGRLSRSRVKVKNYLKLFGKDIKIAGKKVAIISYKRNVLYSPTRTNIRSVGKFTGIEKVGGGVEISSYGVTIGKTPNYAISTSYVSPTQYVDDAGYLIVNYGDDILAGVYKPLNIKPLKNTFDISTTSYIRTPIGITKSTGFGQNIIYGSTERNIQKFTGLIDDIPTTSYSILKSSNVIPKIQYETLLDDFSNPFYTKGRYNFLNSKSLITKTKTSASTFTGGGTSILNAKPLTKPLVNTKILTSVAQQSSSALVKTSAETKLFTSSFTKNSLTTGILGGGSSAKTIAKTTTPTISKVKTISQSRIKPFTLTKPKVLTASRVKVKTASRVKVKSILDVKIDTRSITDTRLTTNRAITTISNPTIITFGGGRIITFGGIPILPPLPKFGGGGGFGSRTNVSKNKSKTGYTPNIFSVSTGFSVKKIPKQKFFTGAEIRPVIIRTTKKKKKKKKKSIFAFKFKR